MKQCPRCASVITSKMKKCDRCGMPLDGVDFSDELEQEQKNKIQQKAEKKAKKKAEKLAKKQAKKEKAEREEISTTDFSKFATNAEKPEEEPVPVVEPGKKGFKGKKAKKKAQEAKPQFELDENGEFNIDTTDVEIVGEETGKIIEEHQKQTYSVKKARGDYREPKIKWWEIYKLADRAFARRKIKREVNKAAKIKPDFINKTKLMLLAIFLGWCGSHNFYAKNKKKGWTQVITFIIWIGVVILAPFVPFLAKVQISVGGCAGFIDCVIWFGDIFNIAFNSFKYRIQKEGFIFAMNVETRAKLGEKYIDLELYKKPWWVRFKVWCQKKRRDYEEWKHERRQKMIEKEKAKLEKAEEQAKIDAEIARKEAMEDAELAKKKQEEASKFVVDEKTISELKSFGDEDTKELKVEKTETKKETKTEEKQESQKEEKAESKPKTTKAKLSVKTSAKKTASKTTGGQKKNTSKNNKK